VCWLQTTLVLAWLWLKSAKLLDSSSATVTWHVQNHPHVKEHHCGGISYLINLWSMNEKDLQWKGNGDVNVKFTTIGCEEGNVLRSLEK
jgi:hypothetical protein